MNTVLWIMQSLVAITFFCIGLIKTLGSKQKLQKIFSAGSPRSLFTTRLIGFLEILGAVGIIFPLLLHVYPFLTAIAGTCLSMVMLGAAAVHLKKKEYKTLPLITILFIFSVIITINRY
jgi:uncharacterized membrane protein